MTPPRTTKTGSGWKKFEQRISAYFPNGKRRGAYVRGKEGAKNDIICAGYSVECKLLARPSYQLMLDACRQAENSREQSEDVAVAVVKRKGDLDMDALVIMRLQEFQKHYLTTKDNIV